MPISGGASINPTLIQTAIPQQAISIGGGSYATNSISNGPQLVPGPHLTGPNLIPGPQLIGNNNYQTGSDSSQTYRGDKLPSFFTTSRPHSKRKSACRLVNFYLDLSRNSIEDVYDEVLPTASQQVADVSVDSKKLVPYDVYLKRNRFLSQLRVSLNTCLTFINHYLTFD